MADDRREAGATRLGNLAEVAGRLTSSLEPKEVAWAAASAIGQAMASASCSGRRVLGSPRVADPQGDVVGRR